MRNETVALDLGAGVRTDLAGTSVILRGSASQVDRIGARLIRLSLTCRGWAHDPPFCRIAVTARARTAAKRRPAPQPARRDSPRGSVIAD